MNQTGEKRICSIEGEEKQKTRVLWEEIFAEDGQAFVDYYYKRKVPENIVYAGYDDKTKEMVSMLHLTPYQIGLGKRAGKKNGTLPSFYIVGVATRENYRHKGYMEGMLRAALLECRQKQIPFVFLMPASPAIYEPYDFRYIYDREEYIWKSHTAVADCGKLCEVSESAYEILAQYCNRFLREEKDYFCLRSIQYYALLQEELKSQNGEILGIYDKAGKFAGEVLHAREEKDFFQEVLCKPEEVPDEIGVTGQKPIIMARIVHIKSFLECFYQKEHGKEVMLTFDVEDPFLPENSGRYVWTLSDGGSTVEQIEVSREEGTGSVPVFQVADLVELFWGRKTCGEIKGAEIFSDIYVWKSGLINEIV